MRLDAHHSFSGRYPLAVLDTILKRNRFDGSILVAAEPALDFSALPGFVRGVVIETERIDPRMLDRAASDPRFRGICCRPVDGPPENLAEIQRRHLTLDVVDGLAWIPRMAESCPDLRMAIVHLGNPAGWDGWRDALAAAARFPQVCCKLSDLIGIAPSPWSAEDLRPYVDHALAAFGPERLMFGSGWPARLPAHAWKESLAAFTQSIGARSQEVRERLLGGTAANFYGIAE